MNDHTDTVDPSRTPFFNIIGSLIMFFLLVVVLSVAVTGCATQQAAIVGYERAALVAVRAAEDNNIALWTANACGTPYSAAIRNPQIVAALKALCLPDGASNAPASLLDGIAKPAPALTVPATPAAVAPPVTPTVLNAAPPGAILTIPPAK